MGESQQDQMISARHRRSRDLRPLEIPTPERDEGLVPSRVLLRPQRRGRLDWGGAEALCDQGPKAGAFGRIDSARRENGNRALVGLPLVFAAFTLLERVQAIEEGCGR